MIAGIGITFFQRVPARSSCEQVIGSGKTAMDVIVHLSRREGGMASRLHCVAGRGTYFMNRDLCFPTDR